MKRAAAVMVMVALAGCGAYPMKMSLPVREQVWDPMHPGLAPIQSVSVRVDHDDTNFGRPWCDLPDASGEVSCLFPIHSLETMPMEGTSGYRGLRYSTALEACNGALWSVGQLNGPSVAEACARALMAFRWIEDRDYDPDNPNR